MEAATATLQLAVLLSLTGLAALGFASRCRVDSRAERLLAAAVIGVALAVATATVLGVAGYLRFWPLLATQALALGAAAVVAERACAFRVLPPRAALARLTLTQQIALAVLGGAYGYVVLLGLIGEPFTGDALMYHLPIAASYAREGRIAVPELGRYWNNDLWAYYPGNAYLLYQWVLLPIGTGALLDLVQLPFAFGVALATYVLARRLGAGERGAVWSALLFLAVPIVINQAKTALVDVLLTFLVASGLAFLYRKPLSVSALVLGALAWGVAPGVKLPAMVSLALGLACVVAHHAERDDLGATLRRAALCIGAVVGGIALLSGYWFARNFALTGSALYPLNLIGQRAVAWSNILFYGPLLPILDFTVYEPLFFYNYETGVGPQYASLAFPGAIALLIAAFRRRRFGPVALALLFLVTYPMWLFRSSRALHTLFRYVLPSVPVGFAAAGWLIGHTTRRRLLEGLALGCVAFSVVNAVPHVGTYILPDSARASLLALRRGDGKLGRFDHMGDLAVQDYRRAWAYVDTLAGERQLSVSHHIFSYALLGPRLQNRLHFLNPIDRGAWREELRRRKIDHVVVGELRRPNGSFTIHTERGFHFDLEGTNTGDEYIVGRRRLLWPAREIRLRYRIPSPENARLAIGINDFAEGHELPTGTAGEELEYIMRPQNEIRSFELFFGFVPRTRIRDQLDLWLSKIEVLDPVRGWRALPYSAAQWGPAAWALERNWMDGDPEHFRLAIDDDGTWGSLNTGGLRIYQVVPE